MAKERFDADADFKVRAKHMVVELQSGRSAEARAIWQKLVEVSKRGFDRIYDLLDVRFPDRGPGSGYCGESFYQDKIPGVISELEGKGLAQRDAEDSIIMFTGHERAKHLKQDGTMGEVPLILRKSDGGFGYDSTDVAAIRYRLQTLKADRLLYVTDAGQEQHFLLVFEAARLAGWIAPHQRVDHVKFGVVMQRGGGKFKTRSGETVTLMSLLDEARETMKSITLKRMAEEGSTTANMTEDEVERSAMAIGYAAVKYADLRNSREKDYEFDAERMLSPDGDTAVYLMYAYARLSSVVEKAEAAIASGFSAAPSEPYSAVGASVKERRLAVRVVRFADVLHDVDRFLLPHYLCGYLYQLSAESASFLTDDNERILTTRGANPVQLEPTRGAQRLLLVKALKAVLLQGFTLLGVRPSGRM